VSLRVSSFSPDEVASPATDAPPPPSAYSPEGEGVAFPFTDGRRSTSAVLREVLADAADAIDPALGEKTRECSDWRSGYVDLLHELTAACGRSPEASLAAAEAGLGSLRGRLVFERGADTWPLDDALEALSPTSALGTGMIRGAGQPTRELRVPYRGRELHGGALRDQLQRWVEKGIVEPSFAEAIELVAANPDWLALAGRTITLVGAGAELAPLEPLCSWGARVVAIDLPEPAIEGRIGAIARAGAGEVTVPVQHHGAQGADVSRALPEVHAWLDGLALGEEPVLGMYAYGDGARHVTATAAFDILAGRLLVSKPAAALAFLATPTDAYLAPLEAIEAARTAYAARRLRRVVQAPIKLATGGRVFTPAYPTDDRVADVLIKQQGPNYAIAKRLQRWRGVLAAQDHEVSFNVAPASWTRSVTKNRILGAAYRSAHRHGIEIFAAETTRALMAALLVHDLHRPRQKHRHPERLFSDAAAHGGLWRAAYEPRSVLSFAALVGLPGSLLSRGAGR
jgi:hypothetical protein